MHSMLALALPVGLGLTPSRSRLATEITPAATGDVAGARAVLLFEKDTAAERVAVAVEATLVREAVPLGRAWRLEAIHDGALVLAWHPGAGAPDDLSDSFPRQVNVDADARELLAGLVAADDLGVALFDARSSAAKASSLTHRPAARCHLVDRPSARDRTE
jgi:hypothetical protein